MVEMEWTFTLADIEKTAEAFWAAVDGYTVFAFHGPMGAGKTTFIHYLCMAKGVKDKVGSPTFALVNEYRSAGPKDETIYHIDLYRLEDEAEAIRAGMEEYLFSGAICMVEWPEKAPGIFPLQTVHVYIDIPDAVKRRVKIEFPAGNL
jgi:tRNA threonylcarbamoyladenosine biosynthesis protein TsaE